ncbi:MAG: hypothetical protein ACO37F_05535 [Pirellulales bacterium]|jgi:ABC-type Fe3+ transport system permease subunit
MSKADSLPGDTSKTMANPTPPPLPPAHQFFMPPPPRSVAASQIAAGSEGFSVPAEAEHPLGSEAVVDIVIDPVQPHRRRRSDTTLLIAILVALAVIVVGLGLAVLFSPTVE